MFKEILTYRANLRVPSVFHGRPGIMLTILLFSLIVDLVYFKYILCILINLRF